AGRVHARPAADGRHRPAATRGRPRTRDTDAAKPGLCALLRSLAASRVEARDGRTAALSGRTPRYADQYRTAHARRRTAAGHADRHHRTNPATRTPAGLESLSFNRRADEPSAAACSRQHLRPHAAPAASARYRAAGAPYDGGRLE